MEHLSSFVLGTAQLGLNYGIANRRGLLHPEDCCAIVSRAIECGVTCFDCARDYGLAEERLRQAFERIRPCPRVTVVTKLDPLGHLSPDADSDQVERAVEQSLAESCRNLGASTLDVLLVHRWEHRWKWRETAWRRLVRARHEGLVGKLGASVQNPAELLEALGEPAIQAIQLPFNLLDWRWKQARVPLAMARRPEVVVHSRSAFLQGLLVSGPEVWPTHLGLQPASWNQRLVEVARELGRDSLPDLCLAYVRAHAWIDGVVLGLEEVDQLEQNLALFERPPLSPEEVLHVEQSLGGAPERLLNPAWWNSPPPGV